MKDNRDWRNYTARILSEKWRTMRSPFFIFIFIMTGAAAAFSGTTDIEEKASPKPIGKARILLVHSYHAEYPWVASITNGVMKALKGHDVELEIFYMDTKRKTSDEWKAEAGQLARKKIESFEPSVVITADDNAQIFVAQNYIDKKPDFVFCGVNGEPDDYGFPAVNITGVIERPDFKGGINYIKSIVKKIHRIAIISDTCPTSIGALNYMRKEDVDVKILGFHLIDDFSIWKKRVLEYNKTADALFIYMYHTIRAEHSSTSMAPDAVMKWTIMNCEIPTVGFFDFSVKDGMLCGLVESGEEQGFEAGKTALSILSGIQTNTIKVKRAKNSEKMINMRTAKKLGLEIPEEILKETKDIIK